MPSPTFGKKRTHRRVVAGAVALAVASLMLASCGQSGSIRGVSLLPAVASKHATWTWTPACPFSRTTPAGCAKSNPDLGDAQLTGDEWNLGGAAAAGSVDMSVDSHGGVTIKGDLQSAPPCTASTCLASSANTWVRGYPSVLYGINQCHANTSPSEAHGFRLPMRVSSIPSDLIGTTSYDADVKAVTYDVAYDMWLNDSDTTKPCSTDGTVEVMVWTDYDERALLPSSLQVGTASVSYSVNGATQPDAASWAVYANNVYRGGQTAPWGGTIWFVLNSPDTVGSGTVSVDLSSVFSAVGHLLDDNYGWHDFRQSYFLDTVPFGIEFGPEDGTDASAGPSRFSLQLSSYCLEVGASLSAAACNRIRNS